MDIGSTGKYEENIVLTCVPKPFYIFLDGDQNILVSSAVPIITSVHFKLRTTYQYSLELTVNVYSLRLGAYICSVEDLTKLGAPSHRRINGMLPLGVRG